MIANAIISKESYFRLNVNGDVIYIQRKQLEAERIWVNSAWVSSVGSTRPYILVYIVMVKASGTDMRQCLYIILILTMLTNFRPSLS